MPFRCKFCEDVFCSEHRLPENHDCEGLRDYKDRSRQEGKVGYDVMKGEKNERTVTVGQETSGSSWDVEDVLPANATTTLLGLLVAAFFLQVSIPGFVDAFILPPDAAAFTQPWRLVTALFLHGGLAHLLVNAIVLWSFGRQLEQMLGVQRYLTLLFTAGILSSIAIAAFGMVIGPRIPALGLSGGLLGLVAFLAVVRPDVTVLAFFVIPLKIRTAIMAFGLFDLANLIVQALHAAGGTAVPGLYYLIFNVRFASSGHLSGLVVGLLFGYYLQDRYRQRQRHLPGMFGGRSRLTRL